MSRNMSNRLMVHCHSSPNSFFVTPIFRPGLGYSTGYCGRILPSFNGITPRFWICPTVLTLTYSLRLRKRTTVQPSEKKSIGTNKDGGNKKKYSKIRLVMHALMLMQLAKL